MRTQKTGTTITVEFLDSQMVIISASPTGEENLIANENGRPFAKESFGNWFRADAQKLISIKAHMESENCQQLRQPKAEHTIHELIAQYGWSNIAQTETYTKGFDRKSLGIKSCKTEIIKHFPVPNPRVRD